jgi:hypothetical protein
MKGWTMISANSVIDQIVYNTQSRKSFINKLLMEPLIQEPDQGPAEVKLLTYPGFIPTNYK